MESVGVGGVEGGGGVVVGSFGFGGGESLAECFPLRWACRLLSTGFRRGAAVEVGGRFCGRVGREVGWCCKWFGVVGVVGVNVINSE